jgi:F0F1-type ATP synthase assembly protein I
MNSTKPEPTPKPAYANPGDDVAWSAMSTLVSGPIVWGGIGAFVDSLIGTFHVFLPIGIAVGFLTAFYIVYVRFGRD